RFSRPLREGLLVWLILRKEIYEKSIFHKTADHCQERRRIPPPRSPTRSRHIEQSSCSDSVRRARGGNGDHQLRHSDVQIRRTAPRIRRIFKTLQFVPDEYGRDQDVQE